MLVHKIHPRHYSLRKGKRIKIHNLDKFFETKSYARNVKPVQLDTEEMRLFNEHMEEVQHAFRTCSAFSAIEAEKIFFNA